MTYDHTRGTTRTLSAYRGRKRVKRWLAKKWVRRAMFAWAIITLPIRAILYSRTAATVFGAIALAPLAVQHFA